MPLDREALQQRLLAAFREEAAERVRILTNGLARWRQGDTTPESIESLYREVHSLKGAARAANLSAIERTCHAWETLFGAFKRGAIPIEPHAVELARSALAVVQRLLANEAVSEDALQALINALEATAIGGNPEVLAVLPESPPLPTETAPASHGSEDQTVRVTAHRLDRLLYLGEAMVQAKLEAQINARTAKAQARHYETLRSRRQAVMPAANLLRAEPVETLPLRTRNAIKLLLDHVDWSFDYLEQRQAQAAQQARNNTHLWLALAQLSDALQQDLQSILLLSCQSVTEGLPGLAQDIAAQTGKQVKLIVQGDMLQIDKRILDELRVVLVHLIRNGIDHGIELPAQREAANKPAVGFIRVDFLQESGDRFEMTVSDDGSGMDGERLKEKALAQGTINEEQAAAMTAKECIQLAFLSGMSTTPMITDLSGRGLGLPIVQERVERLGGRIDLESTSGRGCRFSLHLPLSLSTFRAVIVRTADQLFALPAMAVERCVRTPITAMRRVENRATLQVDEQVLPLWILAEVLQLPPAPLAVEELTVVILGVRGDRIALLVDELLGDQEITVKSLGRQLTKVRNILGATVLGDGQLVPILHPQDLRESALACACTALSAATMAKKADATPVRILVADDSFTSRGLLKGILEAADYDVMTANDGLDAWNALKQGRFDLLVSDVEMPRMDGFTLTSRVRADRELGHLPIVLVTALKSPEDRARGLEAGANAYLAKSGFEGDSLIDAIRRLI